MNGSTPEVTLTESATATLRDFYDLAQALPGEDPAASAQIADRLAEELSELGLMLRALPGRPAAMSGHDVQLLAALRTAHAAGEDVAETIARACARLAAELGGAEAVLSNREGSWEASHIRDLLDGTIGPGGAGGSL
jgi:hypothetical protein